MNTIYKYLLSPSGDVQLFKIYYDVVDKGEYLKLKDVPDCCISTIPKDKVITKQSDLIKSMRELLEANRDFTVVEYYTSKDMFYDVHINLIELGVVKETI